MEIYIENKRDVGLLIITVKKGDEEQALKATHELLHDSVWDMADILHHLLTSFEIKMFDSVKEDVVKLIVNNLGLFGGNDWTTTIKM